MVIRRFLAVQGDDDSFPRMNILVVEDEKKLARFIGKGLEEHGVP